MVQQLLEYHLNTVSSTSDYAREALTDNNLVFVTALHQTKGRGRNGNTWYGTSQENVYCSLGIVHPKPITINDCSMFMARASIATLNVLRSVAPNAELRLKYPNDVQMLSNGEWKKISGALIEHEFRGTDCRSTVVGIGINVAQEHFPDTITQPCTSLHLEGIAVNASDVLRLVKNSLLSEIERNEQEVFEHWCNELNLSGKQVQIVGDTDTFVVEGVQPDGRLLVKNLRTHEERMITDGDSIRYNR